MANALISHSFGIDTSTNIPYGSQTFTSNGTFVAPYSTTYTVVLLAPSATSGNGGEAGNGLRKIARLSSYTRQVCASGGGGGSGGGASICLTPMILQVSLEQSQEIEVTCNLNVVSFGEYGAITSGTAGGNGGDGTDGRSSVSGVLLNAIAGTGGSAGSAGTDIVYSSQNALSIVSPIVMQATSGLSGSNGNAEQGNYNTTKSASGANGGTYNSICYKIGGTGGNSANVPNLTSSYEQETTVPPSKPNLNGLPAFNGQLNIIWGI